MGLETDPSIIVKQDGDRIMRIIDVNGRTWAIHRICPITRKDFAVELTTEQLSLYLRWLEGGCGCLGDQMKIRGVRMDPDKVSELASGISREGLKGIWSD